MWLFNFLKKRKSERLENTIEQEMQVKVDYEGLIEITKIITENNREAVEGINYLVHKPNEFEKQFEEWLNEYDFSPESQPDTVTAFILTGANVTSPYDFGGYVDWKEEANEIIWSLKSGINNKKYPINLEDIKFLNNECGHDAIEVIGTFLEKTDYDLVIWDVGGDCYNLFVIPKLKWKRLNELGKKMKIKFYRVQSNKN